MGNTDLLKNIVAEIDKVEKQEWENLLPLFDDATIYQSWSYGTVRWGKRSLSHLVLKVNNQVVGLAQVTIKKAPFIKAGIAYIPWGPLWQRKDEENKLENIHCLIKALKDEYVFKRGLFLRITPHYYENEDKGDFASILRSEGFQQNVRSNRYRTLLLDLSQSLTEIRKNLDQKWRNQLNRSEKNKMTVMEGSSDDLYKIFLNLQNEMIARKQYEPGVDYGEFREMQKDLPEHQKMRIIVCSHEGEPVTATIGSAIGNTGIYLLGATGDKGLQLKGAYLSQWLTIQWMKDRGCRWYDLGGINPENNPGVYHFKSGLSGIDVRHIGQFERCQNQLSKILLHVGEGINRLKRMLNRRKKG